MKTPTISAILLLTVTLVTGCGTYREYSCSVTGERSIDEPNHNVHLSVVRIVQSGSIYAFPEDLNGADAFELRFTGKTNQVTLDSVSGSYQYKKRSFRPLDLRYCTSSNAVFAPKADSLRNEHLKSGPYHLSFTYALDGQHYTGEFYVDYILKYTTRWWFFWQLRGIGDGSGS